MNKPQTLDGVNYSLRGCTIRILDIDDAIQEGDFIRPLTETPMASESGGWDKTYKDDNWHSPMWHRVEDDFPAWIGQTYRDYMQALYSTNALQAYDIERFIQEEIVRLV